MCREILNSCVRNTEEAERLSKEGVSASSGRGMGKGVWGMIEESELARSIKHGEEKKVRIPTEWCPAEDDTDLCHGRMSRTLLSERGRMSRNYVVL